MSAANLFRIISVRYSVSILFLESNSNLDVMSSGVKFINFVFQKQLHRSHTIRHSRKDLYFANG